MGFLIVNQEVYKMKKNIFFKIFVVLGLFSCALLNAKKLFISIKVPGRYEHGAPFIPVGESTLTIYDFLQDRVKIHADEVKDEILSKDSFRIKTFPILNIGLFLINYDKIFDVERVKEAIDMAIGKFQKRYNRKPFFKFNLAKGFEFYRTKKDTIDVIKKVSLAGKKVQFNDFVLLIKNELDNKKLQYKVLLKPFETHKKAVYPNSAYYAQMLGSALYKKGKGYENFKMYLKDSIVDLKDYSDKIKIFESEKNKRKKKKPKPRYVSLYDLPYWKYADLRKVNLYSTFNKMVNDIYPSLAPLSYVPDCTKNGEPFLSLKWLKWRVAKYIARSKDKKDPCVRLCQLRPYATIAKIYGDRKILDSFVKDQQTIKSLRSTKNCKESFCNTFIDLSLFKGRKYRGEVIAKKNISEKELKRLRKDLNVSIVRNSHSVLQQHKNRPKGGKHELLQDKIIEKHNVDKCDFSFTISKRVKEKIRYIKPLYRFFF